MNALKGSRGKGWRTKQRQRERESKGWSHGHLATLTELNNNDGIWGWRLFEGDPSKGKGYKRWDFYVNKVRITKRVVGKSKKKKKEKGKRCHRRGFTRVTGVEC